MFIKVTLCHVKDRGHYINTDHIQKMVGAYFIPDNISYTELSMIDGSNYAIKESPEDILDMIDDQIAHQEMIKHQVHKPKFKYDFDPLTDIAFYNYG